jgi:uncharacterized RDD family membrane protein YckC
MSIAATSARTVESSHYAGFWVRVLAFLVDGIVIGLVVSALSVGQAGVVTWDHALQITTWRNFIDTAASFVYFTLLWSTVGGGRTVGMRLLGLRVVGPDGQPITYGTAVLRWIGMLVSAAVILLGFIWVAFDPRKQGWHDKIATTFVVHDRGDAPPAA